MAEYIHIGKIAATAGVSGEVLIKHMLGKKADFKNVKAIFIETAANTYLPYFLSKSTSKTTSETIVKVEDLDTKEAAAKLLKKNIWLTGEDFEKCVSKDAPIYLTGFMVLNEGEAIGKVEAVIEQPQQILLQVTYKGKEALIPLHEESLKKIDRKKKQIEVLLPEGLLEIYAG